MKKIIKVILILVAFGLMLTSCKSGKADEKLVEKVEDNVVQHTDPQSQQSTVEDYESIQDDLFAFQQEDEFFEETEAKWEFWEYYDKFEKTRDISLSKIVSQESIKILASNTDKKISFIVQLDIDKNYIHKDMEMYILVDDGKVRKYKVDDNYEEPDGYLYITKINLEEILELCEEMKNGKEISIKLAVGTDDMIIETSLEEFDKPFEEFKKALEKL